MTNFEKMKLKRIQSPEFKRDFKKATHIDKKRVEQNREAYNRMQAKYPTSQDFPFEVAEDFRDM